MTMMVHSDLLLWITIPQVITNGSNIYINMGGAFAHFAGVNTPR